MVGALGGAGALGYSYASTDNHPQATQSAAAQSTAADPATDPPAHLQTVTAANLPNNPWTPTQTDSPPSTQSVPLSIDVYHRSIGTAGEASERPGANSVPNLAETSLPSTIAANYPYSETNGPPNPFATYEIPRPLGVSVSGLSSTTTFTVQAQTSNRGVVRLSQ